jgi:signal transduction histidine kinase
LNQLGNKTRFSKALAVGLSSLTVLVVGALAFQAIDAATAHRNAAENVLKDYATLAAEQFSQRFVQVLSYRVANPLLYSLYLADADDVNAALVTPASLPDSRPERAGPIPDEALAVASFSFRLDLTNGAVTVAGDEVSAETRRWLADTLAYRVVSLEKEDWQTGAVFSARSGVDDFALYRVRADDRDNPMVVYGIGGHRSSVEPLLALANSYGPLLPASLTGETEEERYIGILVGAFYGDTLFTSELLGTAPTGPYDLAGQFQMEEAMGSLVVSAALVNDAAQTLIIGGLPASRVPLLIGLLLLTICLVGAALITLNREYELARLRADFVSGVSHELRTPLAQIRMFAETMLLGRVRTETEAHRSLSIIDQEARRLTHLVENLLYFSRSEKGLSDIAPEPTELESLVRETAEGFTPLAQLKSVKIETVIEEAVVARVDRNAMQQMLLNLLDNATKYGPEGQTVTIGIRRQQSNAEIWVGDEGPGVALQDREHIWERFWRRDEDRKAGITGTGIGLSVVRELAKMHGGNSWVEAASDGAKFVISVPMAGLPA